MPLHKNYIFQAEARAEFAERSVQKLQKEVDRLEGMNLLFLANNSIGFENKRRHSKKKIETNKSTIIVLNIF